MPAAEKVRLTDNFVKAIKPAPAGARRNYWDAIQPGFGVRVTDRGAKSFVLLADGRWVTLGAYPKVGLGAAREMARLRLKEEAERTEVVPELREIAEDFVTKYLPRRRAAKQLERVVRKDIVPALGEKRLDAIRRRDVVVMVERLAEQRGIEAARLAHVVLRKMLNWAISRDVGLESNPAARVDVLPPKTMRSRVLSDSELRAIWHAAAALRPERTAFYRVLMITGQRRGEIAGARWGEVHDLDGSEPVLEVPAERMKGKRPHWVPLTPAAVAILKSLPRYARTPDGFIFTTAHGAGKVPIASFSAAKAALDRELGRGFAEWHTHDLRRTLRSGLGDLGIARDTAELVLAHVQDPLVETYDRSRHLRQKRDALLMWERRLEEIVGPAPEVVAVRRG